MNHVAHASKPQDVVIVTRFLSPKYLATLSINVNNVTKKSIPVRMLSERVCDLAQSIRPIAIVAIKNRDDFSGSASDSFVHCIVVTVIFLRYPLQMRIALQEIYGAIGR